MQRLLLQRTLASAGVSTLHAEEQFKRRITLAHRHPSSTRRLSPPAETTSAQRQEIPRLDGAIYHHQVLETTAPLLGCPARLFFHGISRGRLDHLKPRALWLCPGLQLGSSQCSAAGLPARSGVASPWVRSGLELVDCFLVKYARLVGLRWNCSHARRRLMPPHGVSGPSWIVRALASRRDHGADGRSGNFCCNWRRNIPTVTLIGASYEVARRSLPELTG